MAWSKARWAGNLIVLVILVLYIGSVYRNATESDRRSLNRTEEATGANRVLIIVDITNINPSARQLTAQLGFRFVGDIRQDEQTPKVNLKLLVNNIAGQQEFDFPKGKRMGRIEVTFPMDGDVNKYPLDKYSAYLRFVVTKSGWTNTPIIAADPHLKPELTARPGELTLDEAALQGRVSVPVSVSALASIPGIKFSRDVSPESEPTVTKVDLKIERPSNLIVVSFFIMILMMSLAVSVLIMALKATVAGRKFDLLPLSLSLTLIFGLPALRNAQPGVPPIGALADYFSFIWAESFVAASAIIVMWTWLLRQHTPPQYVEDGTARDRELKGEVSRPLSRNNGASNDRLPAA
jgi:Domain of unknown function (DUF4436)